MIDYRITPTILGCPTWCGLPYGHGFASVDYAGNLMRCHARGFGEGVGSVELTSTEIAAGDDGPIDPTAPLELGIWVNNPGDNQLTGPQARRLAAALMQAADAWDQVQR
jgi:hypothetical protein